MPLLDYLKEMDFSSISLSYQGEQNNNPLNNTSNNTSSNNQQDNSLYFGKIDRDTLSTFDARLYRNLTLTNDGKQQSYDQYFYPHDEYSSYVTDLYETPTSIRNSLKEAEEGKVDQSEIDDLKKRLEYVEKVFEEQRKNYTAPRSFIHPYALVKLAGASGPDDVVKGAYTYDLYKKRRFYEIDGESDFSGHYAKNPTTTTLIRWGNESERGKTPYSFQDFVFCKWWNKIENNRLITLRRYAVPVTDNITFSDYTVEDTTSEDTGTYIGTDKNGNKVRKKGSFSQSPWVPLATAVTYFGDNTDNKLSSILSFSAKYNWKSENSSKDPITVSSTQNDEGSNLVNESAISKGLGSIAKFTGILGEIQNGNTINLDAATGIPPDPYSNGPYANRILGPINVITQTKKRERGLQFTHNGLKLTFEYVSRPIAGVNNKAIMLDLLSNMLVMTYTSGTWFGGMWRYNTQNPALYPWRYGDSMNKMHKGELFGKDGAIRSLTHNVFNDGKGLLSTFIPDLAKTLRGLFDGAVNSIKGVFGIGNKEENNNAAATAFQNTLSTGTAKTIQKLIAAKVTKGTSIPYLSGIRALLTGEPVGDWHLTIGNPLNPIATIGNLVVTNADFEFSDELGPDDFPIGFKVKITLEHGLGRDRDAIESMFNRGTGRIYTLPEGFRSSADRETKIDDYTGTGDAADGNRQSYQEIRTTYYGGGSRGIMKTQHSDLQNKGVAWSGYTGNIPSLKPTNISANTKYVMPSYFVNPWQMAYNM